MRASVALLALGLALGLSSGARAEVLSLKELRGFDQATEARIRAAAEKVNKVFASPRFQALVKSRSSWDNTPNDGATVLRDILGHSHQVAVVGFRPRNPWSKVVASTVFGTAKIQLNSRKLGGSTVDDLAGTLAHELTHLTPETGSRRGYGHGSNSSVGKGASVPYGIGEIVRGWVFEDGEGGAPAGADSRDDSRDDSTSASGGSSSSGDSTASNTDAGSTSDSDDADSSGSATSSRWEPVEAQPKPARSAFGRFWDRIGRGARRLFGRSSTKSSAKSASSSGLAGAVRDAKDED